jgi:hypothetical protein
VESVGVLDRALMVSCDRLSGFGEFKMKGNMRLIMAWPPEVGSAGKKLIFF